MAGGKGQAHAVKMLNVGLGGGSFTPPATVAVGLFSTLPVDGVGGVELSGSGYARVTKNNNTTEWPAATTTPVKNNGTDITFPTATANWASALGAGVWNVSTGELMYWGPFSAAQTINSGATFTIPAGTGTFSEA